MFVDDTEGIPPRVSVAVAGHGGRANTMVERGSARLFSSASTSPYLQRFPGRITVRPAARSR
jgi:hypothetical protein